MRVIQRYRFNIKTKIPFAQWPDVVHRFLQENGLTYRRFIYRFQALGTGAKAITRLQADCPDIGEARVYRTPVSATSCYAWNLLTNMDAEEPFDAEKLLPLMGKIQRGYGFCDSQLCFYDIDFFGRILPFERTGDVLKSGAWALCGSGITLYKSILGAAWMDVNIDVLQDGRLLDASPYCEAMQRLLPGVKVSDRQVVILSEAEKARVASENQAAEALLERCKAYFNECLPGREYGVKPGQYSKSKALKKLAKQYGYDYRHSGDLAVSCLEKRTALGHVLQVSTDTDPREREAYLDVSFQGLGFKHRLAFAQYRSGNQAELEADFGHALDVIGGFERTLLPELDASFPQTPEWFEPLLH